MIHQTKDLAENFIYLNDDYTFNSFVEGTSFAPVVGRAIFFDGYHYPHGVSPINKNNANPYEITKVIIDTIT